MKLIYILILLKSTEDDDSRARYELRFKELMELAVSKDPENGILYFNLGFISLKNNDTESAQNIFTHQFKNQTILILI